MDYIHRDIESEVFKMAQDYPIVTILGPRQSGKTTLIRHLFPNKPYVSLENPDSRQFAAEDPRSFLEQYQDGAILDEIQRLPILLSYLQGSVDENPAKGRFILTGSHQHELHQSVSQSLAGRTALLTLLPLSLSEISPDRTVSEMNQYLYRGFYPRIYRDALEPSKFYRNYLKTYVERDVRQLMNIKDLAHFQHFIKLCASRIGQLFNASSMSNELGVSSNTIHHWLSILEASFIIYRLYPYYENFGKRIIKSPKLYFTDVGLAAYCLDIQDANQLSRDPLRGHLVENLVILECVKHRINQGLEPDLYFYRDSNQNEVDLLWKRSHQLIPMEIKASKTFHPEFLKGLKHFKSLVGDRCSTGFLIYAGTHEQKVGDFFVTHFSKVKPIILNSD